MSSGRLNGIDVSKYQPQINWSDVKRAGYVFAYARATYGSAEVDPLFNSHRQGMKGAGVAGGAYHFFVTAEDATRQAELFVRAVGSLGGGDLPPVLDVEAESGTGANLVGGVRTWLAVVEQRLGRTPVIYTGPAFWNANLTGDFGRHPLWVAEYGVASPRPVNGWDGWTFWQHSESGAVNGIDGGVDLDYFNGSLADLEALANAPAGSLTADTPAEPPASTPTITTPATNIPTAPSPTSTGAQTYTVRPGDTLSAIADRYGTTVDALSRANGIANPNEIEAGQVLTISHAPFGSTSPAVPAAHVSSGPRTYTVQPGDTLSAIAARYGTTAETIAQANHIEDENLIDVGRVLTIP
jgi:lysozyme